jgi:DNA-binding transcriptional ArsR family regulator
MAARWGILRCVPKYLVGLDRLFFALSDGTRRAMVERLSRGPASVSTLAEPFDMSLPTVVQHLAMLEEVGIVSSEKVGRVRTYQLVPDGLVAAHAWIVDQRTPQTRQLDRLGDHLSRNLHTGTEGR